MKYLFTKNLVSINNDFQYILKFRKLKNYLNDYSTTYDKNPVYLSCNRTACKYGITNVGRSVLGFYLGDNQIAHCMIIILLTVTNAKFR